jgi:hypothetical protein
MNGSPKCLPGLCPRVSPDPEQVLGRQESAESITFRSMGNLNAYLGFVPGSPPDPEQVLRQQESRKHNQQINGSPKSLPGFGTRVAPYPEQILGRQESAESITYRRMGHLVAYLGFAPGRPRPRAGAGAAGKSRKHPLDKWVA